MMILKDNENQLAKSQAAKRVEKYEEALSSLCYHTNTVCDSLLKTLRS